MLPFRHRNRFRLGRPDTYRFGRWIPSGVYPPRQNFQLLLCFSVSFFFSPFWLLIKFFFSFFVGCYPFFMVATTQNFFMFGTAFGPVFLRRNVPSFSLSFRIYFGIFYLYSRPSNGSWNKFRMTGVFFFIHNFHPLFCGPFPFSVIPNLFRNLLSLPRSLQQILKQVQDDNFFLDRMTGGFVRMMDGTTNFLSTFIAV